MTHLLSVLLPVAAHRPRGFLALFAFAAALLLGAASARADVDVAAKATPDRLYLGDTFTLQIEVNGASSAKEPDLSGLTDFDCKFLGGQDRSSRSVTIINGRRSEQIFQGYVMQYRVRPLKTGRLRVPPLSVDVGGKAYTTNELRISVMEPADSADFKLRLECARESAYVGEAIPVKLVWYIGREVEPAAFAGPDGGAIYDILPSADTKAIADARTNSRSNRRAVNFLNAQAVGVLSQGTLESRTFTTLTIECSIVPKQAGEITIGPYSAAFDASLGPFRSERMVIASNAHALRVKALPTAGRPADFSGLVGRFAIESSAGASEANVGDPIPFTVRITGAPPLDRVMPPNLEALAAFASAFKGSPEGWETKKETPPGERVFTTTLRPKSDDVKEIPSVSLSFFDTEVGEYRTRVTPPIPLKVRPTREVTIADAVGGGRAIASPGAIKLTPGGPAMRGNFSGTGLLTNQRVDALAVIAHPASLALVAGPPLAILGALVARRLRAGAGERSERVRRAAREAKRGVARAGSIGEVGEALRGFAGALTGVAPEAVTSADVRGGGHQSLAACLERCESAAYGASALDLATFAREATTAIDEACAAERGGVR